MDMTSVDTDRVVAPERTGERDLGLSLRHRSWGWDAPALDLDFLEYDHGHPVALIEYYRYGNGEGKNPDHPSMRALAKLGTLAQIPVFTARYTPDFQHWWVEALNEYAGPHVGDGKAFNSELEFVTFLYRLRNRGVPGELMRRLQAQK